MFQSAIPSLLHPKWSVEKYIWKCFMLCKNLEFILKRKKKSSGFLTHTVMTFCFFSVSFTQKGYSQFLLELAVYDSIELYCLAENQHFWNSSKCQRKCELDCFTKFGLWWQCGATSVQKSLRQMLPVCVVKNTLKADLNCPTLLFLYFPKWSNFLFHYSFFSFISSGTTQFMMEL